MQRWIGVVLLLAGAVLLTLGAIWALNRTAPSQSNPDSNAPANPGKNPNQTTRADTPRGADTPRLDPAYVRAVSSYLEDGDLTGGGRAHAHPHGTAICASGCAVSNHPTRPLAKAEFHQLLTAFAGQPMSEESQALEALMYYGRQALLYLDREGASPLDAGRAAFLRQQLLRTHVLVHIRVVDEHGKQRVSMPPARVPLDIRHEFVMDTADLQPLKTSGTVKRVGLNHLWQRL